MARARTTRRQQGAHSAFDGLEAKFFDDGDRGLVMLEPPLVIPSERMGAVVVCLGAIAIVISTLFALM